MKFLKLYRTILLIITITLPFVGSYLHVKQYHLLYAIVGIFIIPSCILGWVAIFLKIQRSKLN